MDHPTRGDESAYQRYFAGMDASMDQKDRKSTRLNSSH